MLRLTAEAARRHGIPLSVCGEMAGDIRALPIWLGLGITDLSMSVQSILRLKNRILRSEAKQAKVIVDKLFNCTTSASIMELLNDHFERDMLEQTCYGGDKHGA